MRLRIIGWVSVVLTAVLVVAVLGVYFVVRSKLDSVGRINFADSQHRPHKYGNALNILLLGSDSRSGHNKTIGGKVGCDCSDTIMIAHISPGHHKVTVLSIPRDTMVPLYACDPVQGTPGQQADASAFERINATLEAGGPECVREAVEQQTGIRIDTIIQLDFTGFQKVINDVHGVNVCVPATISDPIRTLPDGQEVGSGLHLTAGRHHITGRVALEFWRARYALADGSDLARIKRDQYLMAQMVKGVLHKHLLSSLTTLYRVVGDVASSISTDASTSELVQIAFSLHGISSRDVQFVTAPTVPYPGDPTAELSFASQAAKLFSAIARDQKLPKRPKHHKGHHGTGGTILTLKPSQVKVSVLNGTSQQGLAGKVAAQLTTQGFGLVGQPGNASSATFVRSQIGYGSAAARPAANTLLKLFPKAALKQVSGLPAGTVQLIIGSGFTTLAVPSQPLGKVSGSFSASSQCRNNAFFGVNLPKPKGKLSCAC